MPFIIECVGRLLELMYAYVASQATLAVPVVDPLSELRTKPHDAEAPGALVGRV
jgi:hypothetical protein